MLHENDKQEPTNNLSTTEEPRGDGVPEKRISPDISPSEKALDNASSKSFNLPTLVMAGASIITAVATVSLALYTSRTLDEVTSQRDEAIEQRKIIKQSLEEQATQREIMFEQLKYEKTPQIIILRPSPFHFGNVTRFSLGVGNFGGPAQDISFRYILMYGASLEELPILQKDLQARVGQHSNPLVTKYINFSVDFWVPKDDLLTVLAKDLTSKKPKIFLYEQVIYFVPTVTGKGKSEKIIVEDFEYWDSIVGKWGNLKDQDRKKVFSVITKLGIMKKFE